MSQTYDTLGGSLTVTAQGSTNVIGAQNSLALVGGYDAADADTSVSPGNAYQVGTSSEGYRLFGGESELGKEIELAVTNGIDTVYAAPVAETTDTTESFTSSSNGTLSNVPFDPSLQTEHSFTVQDTTEGSSVTVERTWESPPTAPTEENTMAVNFQKGEWAADAESDYDITYSYGNYESAIKAACASPARFVAVATEDESAKLTLQTELQQYAMNFDFKLGIVGARPHIQTADVGSYTTATDDLRMIEVAPSRGFRSGYELRTVAGIAAVMARQPVNANGSITYESVRGLEDLGEAYMATTAQDFEGVTALTRQYEIAEGVTTSSDPAFADIFHVSIIDEVSSTLFEVAKQYRGLGNFEENQDNLEADLKTRLKSFASQSPPLLATGTGDTPYNVAVATGATDQTVNVNVGIEIVDVMKTVNLNLNVGEFTSFTTSTSDGSDSGTASGSSDSSSGSDGSSSS